MANQGNEQDNTDAKFDILFRGDIAPGKSIEQVKARVAESFKLDEAAVNQLFSGAVVSLKRNIDRATAERIFQRLSDAGALANIVPSNKEPGNTAPLDKEPEPDKQSEPDKQLSDKALTLAPLGSDVLEAANKPEQELDHQSISVDHLGLEPVGSNIIEDSEGETIEPVTVDTSHLTLDLTPE